MPTVQTDLGVIAGLICYDLDYTEQAAVDADIMLAPAADWEGFGRLHTEKTRLRAVEHGYSLVRHDAYGLSGAYDPQGRQLAQADWHATDQLTMVAEIPTEGRRTIYARIGDVFAWSCCVFVLGASMWSVALCRKDRQRVPADDRWETDANGAVSP